MPTLKSRYVSGNIGHLVLTQMCNPLILRKLLPSFSKWGTARVKELSRRIWGLRVGLFTRLFKGNNGSESDVDPASACSAEDYEEFINYLRGKDRPFSKPGRTIKEEFRFWLADRTKRHGHASAYNASRQFAAAIQK